ncbi:MAG TPA: DNA primase [Oculatellaceae cyanobacterium]|jgi:DNA primase
MQIPRLHPDTIEQVKERADIVDVVSEHVVLRKRGKDYQGLCPFHEEKTPSFTVSPGKQMYYCFGCQAGGNAIKFLMEVGKRAFGEVVLDLARRYQVPVQTLEPEQRQELQRQLTQREQLFEILAVAANFYQHALRQPQGNVALEYLKSERGLTEETIQNFQLGYAPSGWEILYKYLVEQKSYPVQLVEKAGLIVPRKSGGGYYDRFRDRLMIPIHDTQGRVIGFGGRTLTDEQPKYLNSPETELFDKGRTLFALDKAKDAIGKRDQAVVVEGYFDAIALHEAGINNVVASLGTALSLDQVKQLLRYTDSKRIVLNFDADAAGTNAAERAIGEIANLAYQGEVQLRILNLPKGKDADEFVKGKADGAAQYQELLDNAPLWLDWQIQQTLVNRDISQADQFQQVAQEMVKLLSNIENAASQIHYLELCAKLLSKDDSRSITLLIESLRKQLKKLNLPLQPKSNTQQQFIPLPAKTDRDLLNQAEILLLKIYIHCPEYREDIIFALEDRDLLFSLQYHLVWQYFQDLALKSPEIIYTSEVIISLLQDFSVQLPKNIANFIHLFHLDEKSQLEILNPHLVIRTAVASLERVKCEQQRRYCLQKWRNLEKSAKDWVFYYQQFHQADRRIHELDQERYSSFEDVISIY